MKLEVLENLLVGHFTRILNRLGSCFLTKSVFTNILYGSSSGLTLDFLFSGEVRTVQRKVLTPLTPNKIRRLVSWYLDFVFLDHSVQL